MAKADVLPFCLDEVAAIEPLIRQADREEITEALGIPMTEALRDGIKNSYKASKIMVNGDVVAVFGDAPYSLLGSLGVPWLISTVNVERHPRAFLAVCKPEVAEMLQRHTELVNYVDVRNTVAIRWLRWLGFTFDNPEPYGPKGMLFQRFWMRRAPCA